MERPESGISIITPCTGVRVVSRGRDEASQHGCGTGRNGHGLDRVRYARHRPRTVPEPSPSESASAEPTAEQAAIDAYESVGRDRAGVREEDADPPELELYAMAKPWT